MAGEWPETPLGELVQNFDSRRIPLSSREREKRRGEYPYYGATGVMDHVDDYLFEGLHLLVAEDGSVERPDGKPFLQLVNGRFWVNNHAHVLKAATDEDTKFLYYALSTVAIRPYMSGSVQAKLSQGNLNRIPTAYPCDEADRRAIAHILGTLDDKIELNRRLNETLEAIARALFKSWFVDFDPVRAKAEGRDPGLPGHLADLFPARLVESELGEIPEGWGVGPIGRIAELMIGGDWGRDTPEEGDVPVRCLRGVDIDSLRRTGWSAAPIRFISASSHEKRQPSFCDVFVEGSGECGRSLAAQWVQHVYQESVIYSNFCKRVRCSSTDAAFYVEFGLNQLVATGDMKNFVTGTAMPNLDHKGLLAGHVVVVPPSAVLKPFGTFVSRIRGRLFSAQSRTVAALRDTLLPKLVSGELRVDDAERFVERGGA